MSTIYDVGYTIREKKCDKKDFVLKAIEVYNSMELYYMYCISSKVLQPIEVDSYIYLQTFEITKNCHLE